MVLIPHQKKIVKYKIPITEIGQVQRHKKESTTFGCISLAPESQIQAYLGVDESSGRHRDFVKIIYVLPEGGEIHHILGGNDPEIDELFMDFQKSKLPFQRMPVKSPGIFGLVEV